MGLFKCRYCTLQFDSFKTVIHHGINLHPDKELSYKKLSRNDIGPFWRSENFFIIPGTLNSKIFKINLNDEKKQ